MQELVSFISIIVGVIVLTAWAMWLWVRPNGDSKTLDLGDKLSRDGMTRTVMENNDLKNKLKLMERELKALSSKGQPEIQHQAIKEVKEKDEPVEKQQEPAEAKPEVRAASIPDPVPEFELEPDLNPDSKPGSDPGKSKDKRRAAKDERKKAEKEKKKSRENLLKIKELKTQIRENEAKSKLKAKAKLAEQEVISEKKKNELNSENESSIVDPVITSTPQNENKAIEDEANDAVLESDAALNSAPTDLFIDDVASEQVNVVPLSEGQRIINDAEKKKIAKYLASVAKTTERHMKEVEAIDEQDKIEEVASKFPENDLKKIKGIGPHLEGKLKKSGIRSYQQIASLTEDDLKQISEIIGSYPRRIRREKWIEQAKVLVEKE